MKLRINLLLFVFISMFFAGCNGIINTTDDNCIPENLSEQPLQSTSIQRKTECWSDELQELMCTINEEHKSIIKPEINLNLYNKYFPNEEDTSLLRSNSKEKAETISKEQALEDTEYLMDALSSSYSLYTCFDEFDTVWKQIQKIIEQQEIWTYDDFKQVLLEQLNFVKDWHFFIDELSTATATIPFFYKEVEYQKSGDGIYSGEKKVISVDGYDDIDMLSLSHQLKNISGKKKYGYLKAPLKDIVDEIVSELEKDSRVKEAYDLWYRMRDEVLHTYRDDVPQRVPLCEQKEFKRIKNIVIEEAVKLGEIESTQIHVAQSVTRLLKQLSNIFQDKTPNLNQDGPKFTDRKLLRKMREKKAALGDKGTQQKY